jgi:tetratricopeptide (TPR) repeat protein
MRADVAANRILDNEKLDKEQILSAINIWPALKTTELIAVAASGVDSNCEVLDDLAERMIEIDVRSAQGWYLEAICRNVKKEFSEAFSASERTLDLDPLNPVYLVANAKLALASGKKEEAITSIKTLKSNFPENAELGALESFISSQP